MSGLTSSTMSFTQRLVDGLEVVSLLHGVRACFIAHAEVLGHILYIIMNQAPFEGEIEAVARATEMRTCSVRPNQYGLRRDQNLTLGLLMNPTVFLNTGPQGLCIFCSSSVEGQVLLRRKGARKLLS
jgi:hypothetical protein